jgi:hypothetical protein
VGVAGSDGEFTFLVERIYSVMAVPSDMGVVVSGFLSGEICSVLFDEIYKGGATFTQLENSRAEYGY